MAELKNSLRSGDISVVGSRQFRDFKEYLLPRTEFDRRFRESNLHVSVSTSPANYLEEHVARLREALDDTDALARTGDMPDVELNSTGR